MGHRIVAVTRRWGVRTSALTRAATTPPLPPPLHPPGPCRPSTGRTTGVMGRPRGRTGSTTDPRCPDFSARVAIIRVGSRRRRDVIR